MLEISHIQAMTLRTLLHRAKSLLSTVETAGHHFDAERNAVVRDCEDWQSCLLRQMHEASPALTRQYEPLSKTQRNLCS